MGFSRQEYWSEFPCPPPGNLSDPGTEPVAPALQADSLPGKHWRTPYSCHLFLISSASVRSLLSFMCSHLHEMFLWYLWFSWRDLWSWVSLVAQMVKNLPAMQETWVRSLGWEDLLEKIPLQDSYLENSKDRGAWWAKSLGLQRVGHNWAVHSTFSVQYGD